MQMEDPQQENNFITRYQRHKRQTVTLLGWPTKHESKQLPNEKSNVLKMG